MCIRDRLSDHLFGAEYTPHRSAHNLPLWDEKIVTVKEMGPGVKPKKYNLFNNEEKANPFGSELFNSNVNKMNPFLTVTSTPTVIPAESPGQPTLPITVSSSDEDTFLWLRVMHLQMLYPSLL